MSVEIDLVRRRVTMFHPKVAHVHESAGIIFVRVASEGVEITMSFDVAEFRNLMMQGREIVATQAERLRAELGIVESLAENPAPEVAS